MLLTPGDGTLPSALPVEIYHAGRKGARQTGVPRSENVLMNEKQDPENREESEETPTSNCPASTGRRNNDFRGQAAENPWLSSYVFPRAGEPWMETGRRLLPSFPHLAFREKLPTWKDLF